jgi:hypothetical protein
MSTVSCRKSLECSRASGAKQAYRHLAWMRLRERDRSSSGRSRRGRCRPWRSDRCGSGPERAGAGQAGHPFPGGGNAVPPSAAGDRGVVATRRGRVLAPSLPASTGMRRSGRLVDQPSMITAGPCREEAGCRRGFGSATRAMMSPARRPQSRSRSAGRATGRAGGPLSLPEGDLEQGDGGPRRPRHVPEHLPGARPVRLQQAPAPGPALCGGTSREFSVLERGNLPCFVVLGVCQGQCRRDRSLSRKRRAFC